MSRYRCRAEGCDATFASWTGTAGAEAHARTERHTRIDVEVEERPVPFGPLERHPPTARRPLG